MCCKFGIFSFVLKLNHFRYSAEGDYNPYYKTVEEHPQDQVRLDDNLGRDFARNDPSQGRNFAWEDDVIKNKPNTT